MNHFFKKKRRAFVVVEAVGRHLGRRLRQRQYFAQLFYCEGHLQRAATPDDVHAFDARTRQCGERLFDNLNYGNQKSNRIILSIKIV